MKEPVEPPHTPKGWHWLIRIPVGLLIGLLSIACAAFSTVLVFAPPPRNPLLAQCIGALMIMTCLWTTSLGIRLIANRPDHGGLLSPFALRLVAVYMLAVPTFILVTERHGSWSPIQYLQAGAYIMGSFGVWRIAAWREASHLEA